MKGELFIRETGDLARKIARMADDPELGLITWMQEYGRLLTELHRYVGCEKCGDVHKEPK